MMVDFRRLDKSYLIVALVFFRSAVPWISSRTGAMVPALLLGVFMIFKLLCPTPVGILRETRYYRYRFWWMVFASILFLAPNLVWWCFGYGDLLRYDEFAAMVQMSLAMWIMHYSILRRKFNELKFLACVSMVGIAVAGLFSLKGLGADYATGAARAMMVATDNYDALLTASDMAMQGFGKFGFMYTISEFVGAIALAWWVSMKQHKILMGVSFFVLLLSCCVIVRTGGLATPMGVMVASTGICMVAYLRKSNRLGLTLGLIACALFFVYALAPVFFSWLSGPLRNLGESMGAENAMGDHLLSMADSFSGDRSSYAASRASLQMVSWDVFCRHPIAGVGAWQPVNAHQMTSESLGGHSVLLDLLAKQGIFGFVVFALYIWHMYAYWVVVGRKFLGEISTYMALGVFMSFVFACVSNNIPKDVSLLLYEALPGLAIICGEMSWRRMGCPVRNEYARRIY